MNENGTTLEEYEAEYNKAFYGEGNEPTAVVIPEEEEITNEEIQDGNSENDSETNSEDNNEGDREEREQSVSSEGKEEGLLTPTFKITHKGKELELTEDEIKALATKGFDYTAKTQYLAENRKTAEKIKNLGLSDSDLEIMAKIKSGDTSAAQYLLQQSNIDSLDVDSAPKYNFDPTQQSPKVVISQQVSEVEDALKQDEVLYSKVSDTLNKLPQSLVSQAASDIGTFTAIINEVQSGDFEVVYPKVVLRLSMMSDIDKALATSNPANFANLYSSVKDSLRQPEIKEKTMKTEPKKQINMAEVAVRKSSAVSGDIADEVEKDAWNDDETYKRLLAKARQ